MRDIYNCFCPVCKKVTIMDFHDSGHERDSSGDFYECSECGELFFPTFGDEISE